MEIAAPAQRLAHAVRFIAESRRPPDTTQELGPRRTTAWDFPRNSAPHRSRAVTLRRG